MKRNLLLLADGDVESDLDVIDAVARIAHDVRRASTQSHPWQILRRNLKDIDAVIIDLDKHSHALSIVEALGCSDNMPPVIAPNEPAKGDDGISSRSYHLRDEAILSRGARVGHQQCLPAHASIRCRTSDRSDVDPHTEVFATRTVGLKYLLRCKARKTEPPTSSEVLVYPSHSAANDRCHRPCRQRVHEKHRERDRMLGHENDEQR